MRTLTIAALALGVAALAAVSPAHAGKQDFTVPVTEPAPATLYAEMYTPSGPGPYPTVLLMHGCGGVSPNVPAWAVWLQSQGYAAVVLNSFSGRNIRNLCGDSKPLLPEVRVNDAYAAVARLKTMGAVDSARIAVMGFSHGGSTSVRSWAAQARHPNEQVRAFVAFYPGCRIRLPKVDAKPLLVLIGGKDDWSPPEPCEELAKNAEKAGLPLTFVLYPEARHHFDGAENRRIVYSTVARGGKGASLAYDPAAHEDSEKQVKKFLAEHLRPSR